MDHIQYRNDLWDSFRETIAGSGVGNWLVPLEVMQLI